MSRRQSQGIPAHPPTRESKDLGKPARLRLKVAALALFFVLVVLAALYLPTSFKGLI